MADTRRDWTIRPSLPGPEKPAGSVCSLPRRSICVCSAPQRFFLHTYPRTRSSRSRRWDVAQIGGRAWKGAWHGRSTRFQRFRSETTPAGTSRGGAATPSSNILNFFSLSPPPAVCSRVCCESNDPRLSRKGFRNGVVWLPLRDFLLFFFFFFPLFDSLRRGMANSLAWLSVFLFFYPWKRQLKNMMNYK